MAGGEVALIEQSAFHEAAVLRSSVAAAYASAQPVVRGAAVEGNPRLAAYSAERASFYCREGVAALLAFGHDVYGTAERRVAEHASRCPLEHLNALYV